MIGTKLAHYEITSHLGTGGMGEVYRAMDSKLGRSVAIKLLPAAFASDADRLSRFLREAQLLATLNHPNIAQIYGIEESGDTRCIVMELIEGETLQTRIRNGPIQVDEALVIAKQIAEALEAAHEKGVVHRDLKPGNVMLTSDGRVKVLDFGLAKAYDTNSSSATSSNSPTMASMAATNAGVILGTAAYMSPEQARGKVVDKRADIWAFGCVLYEMLTGQLAFPGEDLTDTLGAVLKLDPKWDAIRPASVRTVLRRCLQKDPKQRLRDIGDVRLALEGAFDPEQTTIQQTLPPRPQLWRRIASLAGVAAGAGVLVGSAVWFLIPPAAPVAPIRFAIVPPEAQQIARTATDRQIAISPDGTHLAYIASHGQLIVRALDRLETEPVHGITGARLPFFSPDGKWVAFFHGDTNTRELKKVSIAGGAVITLCSVTGNPAGASWGQDDTIVFTTGDADTGLLSVPAAGGKLKVLTKPDPARGEADHLFPSVLPGGGAVLFTITGAGGLDDSQVAVLDLKTGVRKSLIRGGGHAEYVESGHLVYAAAGSLLAVRFDPVRLNVLSDPVPLMEKVAMTASGAAEFSVSRSGALLYIPDGSDLSGVDVKRSLVWVDRRGREEPLDVPQHGYVGVRLSPDNTQVALDVRSQGNDIWIWDLARHTLTKLTFDPQTDAMPVWTPDGRRIVFCSDRGSTHEYNLFVHSSNGTGTDERLRTADHYQCPMAFSPDGKGLVLTEVLPKTGDDLTLLAMDGKGSPTPLVQTKFDENSDDLSPDGRWLAYQSTESGQNQIYVRPFPNTNGGRWQISTGGGTRPLWARNGRELFYLDANNLLTTVSVQTTPSFSAGKPMKLLQTSYLSTGTRGRMYDLSPDGQRFLMIKDAPGDQISSPTPVSMIVVLNWFEELKERVPRR